MNIEKLIEDFVNLKIDLIDYLLKLEHLEITNKGEFQNFIINYKETTKMDEKMNDVIDEVQKRLGEEYEVKRVEVMKNNDTKLKGIQVRRKDMNVAKICYWTSESIDEIVAVINRSLFPKFDCEINLEKLKERIVYTLVNANSNKSRLKTIPYRMLEGTDLAITYKLII